VLQDFFYGVTQAKVNSTCFTINNTDFCNQSSTNIEINITPFSDTIAPIITNLRNTSTTNESSYIEWDCDETCNYTISWYNQSFSFRVGSIANSSVGLNHNPHLVNLTNSTTYLINLTVCDGTNNCRTDLTFNFTTASNEAASVITDSGGSGGGQSPTTPAINVTNTTNITTILCSKELPIWDRLLSTCKDPLNKICDDGEMPIINLDCNIKTSKFVDNEIFSEIWLLRLMILITIILFIIESKDYLFFLFLDAVLLVFNDAFKISPLVEQVPSTIAAPVNCTGWYFLKNLGGCIWKSNVKIGWAIVILLLFVLVYLIARWRVKVKLRKTKKAKTITVELQ
jgi:hypothetical protein